MLSIQDQIKVLMMNFF